MSLKMGNDHKVQLGTSATARLSDQNSLQELASERIRFGTFISGISEKYLFLKLILEIKFIIIVFFN